VTKKFENLAQTSAKGKGLPNLPLNVLPFPFDQLPDKEIRDITNKSVADVIRALAPSEGRGKG